MPTTARSTSRDKVRAHRTRLRKAGFVPFRSGFRTCGRSPSPRPHTVSRWRWRRVLTPSGTSRSSTQFLPGMKNETWRDLDRRGWSGLCGQAATRGHRPGRSVRRERFDRRVPLDHRSDAGTDLQAFRPAQCPEWTACTMPDDGGQVDCRAEETPRKAGRLTGLRRSEGAQPRHFRIPGFGGNGSVARLASRRASEPLQPPQPRTDLVPGFWPHAPRGGGRLAQGGDGDTPRGQPEGQGDEARRSRAGAYQRAELMRRTFGLDVLACPQCGGRLRLVALIDRASVVQRILRHLGLPTRHL